MEPALGGLNGMRAFAVLHLHDGVIVAGVDNLLFFHLSMGDVVNECPADATAATGIDEAVLRACIKGILAVNKFGMKHHVTLLTLGLQVGQAFPVNQIFRACDGSRGRSSTKIAGLAVVMTLRAEDAVNPAILMGRESHVVDVGCGNHIVGHRDGFVPKAEVVDTVGALCHGKERFAVGSLHAHHEQVFALPLDGS